MDILALSTVQPNWEIEHFSAFCEVWMINGAATSVEAWNVGLVPAEAWVGRRVAFLMCGIMFATWSPWYEWISESEILSSNLSGRHASTSPADIMTQSLSISKHVPPHEHGDLSFTTGGQQSFRRIALLLRHVQQNLGVRKICCLFCWFVPWQSRQLWFRVWVLNVTERWMDRWN